MTENNNYLLAVAWWVIFNSPDLLEFVFERIVVECPSIFLAVLGGFKTVIDSKEILKAPIKK